MKLRKNLILGAILLLLAGGTLSACDDGDTKSSQDQSPRVSSTSKSSAKPISKAHHKKAHVHTGTSTSHHAILTKLVGYTNKESAGPTGDYYWVTGKAHFNHFSGLKSGDYRFTSDSQGRSATARAVLTYSEYQASQGSRQGEPLAPPAWPENKIVAITYGLTGRTYHATCTIVAIRLVIACWELSRTRRSITSQLGLVHKMLVPTKMAG